MSFMVSAHTIHVEFTGASLNYRFWLTVRMHVAFVGSAGEWEDCSLPVVALAIVLGSIPVALGGERVGVYRASDWGFIVGGSSVTTGPVSSDRSGSVSWPAVLVSLVYITVGCMEFLLEASPAVPGRWYC